MEATRKQNLSEQLESVATMVNMVISSQVNALFLYGTPGIGKSSVVMEQFNARGLKVGKDYLFVKGVTRPMGLYTLLYENKDGTLVFDDCDTAWGDENSANILKAALEMSGPRVVAYYSKAIKDAGMPTSFEFTGSVIFISNLGEDEVDGAIRSRSYCKGVFATIDEMTAYMEQMLEKIEPFVSIESKREALAFLTSVRGQLRSFDLRTLVKTIRLMTVKKEWRELALQFV